MANIKLDKNMIASVRFTVADESRLLVVLQFSVFFAERFSCEKRTLLLMLNFNNYCLSVGRFTRLFTAYSLIAIQKKNNNNNKHTVTEERWPYFLIHCWRIFCLYQKVGKVN